MTRQMQQAMRLLHLPHAELADLVGRELADNPLLQRMSEESTLAADASSPAADVSTASDVASDTAPAITAWGLDDPTGLAGGAGRSGFPPYTMTVLRAGSRKGGSVRSVSAEAGAVLEETVANPGTLRSHLLGQLALEVPDAAGQAIGMVLIDHLDETGWLTASPEEIAEDAGVPAVLVAAVLARLQAFDPPGIFARSLRECLALQLAERDRLDPAMQALLDNLDSLASGDLPSLAASCGVDADKLASMVVEIRSLDPKPGLRFEDAPVEILIPDILLQKSADGDWRLELNPETLPRVVVDADYYATVRAGTRNAKEANYVREQFQNANWLVRCLHRRALTMLAVAGEIVRLQDGFLRSGIRHLRPLTLRAVATAVNLHESTVSRVVANKSVATPRGVFSLKFFFTTALSSLDGEPARSAAAVRFRIREMVGGESLAGALSDAAIAARLRDEGVDIARRTVAKYRETMRIGSSVERRRGIS